MFKYGIGPHSDGAGYAPSAPPWVRIELKRRNGKRPADLPWHYIDYTREGKVRMPTVCGGSIDVIHNADKNVALSLADPPDHHQVCHHCLWQMRQPYTPIRAREITFWTAQSGDNRFILMRRNDMICYAFPADRWTEARIARADPRAILSEAIDEGIPVMTAEEALELDLSGYRHFGYRIHG